MDNLYKHRLRYHAGWDGHVRLLEPWCMPCLESGTHSLVHKMRWRNNKGTEKQAPDVPDNSRTIHAVLNNNNCARQTCTVHTVSTQNHTSGLSWNESGYTKAKLKTSPVVTGIMFPPYTGISALLLGVSTTFSSPSSAVKVGDQLRPHCSPPVSVATRNISCSRLASPGP